jgi:sulfur-oxidizing protein SoxA
MRCSLQALWALALTAIFPLLASAQPSTSPDAQGRRSGFADMAPATQAMQRDDRQNPAMLWVADGEALWGRKMGSTNKSCADCHGAVSTLRGVATQYPRFDAPSQKPVALGERINLCRQRHQQAPMLPTQDERLIALEAVVANQSRGMSIRPDHDPRLQPFRQRGEALFTQRFGQLDLSCAQCHDQQAGRLLGGTPIPQAHPTGYPLYRLEWQGMGTLQRRLRNCMSGVRAVPFAFGSPELVALELYLVQRAAGMPLETPAVRP